MSQDSGGGCCCCQPRPSNKVVPVINATTNYRIIEIRPRRYICMHYFNPYPRDDKFQKQMQSYLDKHQDKQNGTLSSIPRYEKKKETKEDKLPDLTHSESKNNQSKLNGENHLASNSVQEIKTEDPPSSVQATSAKDHPPVLSPSELTMLSLKSNTFHEQDNAYSNSDFVPLPDCTSKIKYPNRTIFLIHGVGGSADIWTAQTQYFVDLGFEVLVPEWIGHGCCPGSSDPRDYYFEEIVKDLSLIFDLHCKKSNIVIGHSYGSCFAAVLARTRPRLVQSLVMISGGGPTPLAPQSSLFKAPLCLLICLSPLLRYCLMQRAFYKKNSDPVEQEKAFDVSTSVIRNTMNGQRWEDGNAEYHNSISCPTLLIHGSEDQLISLEEELQMIQAIYGSQLQVIEEASHMVMIERPAEVNAFIKQLISGNSVQTHEPVHIGLNFGSTESVESHSKSITSHPEQTPHQNKLIARYDLNASPSKSARSIPSRIFSAKRRT